jgi:acetolactate synthase-1/2/3 large subunit
MADGILGRIAAARHPVVLAGPALSARDGRRLLTALEEALAVPSVVIESPRGLADASLGAFPELIAEADLVVLLGKALDFTLRWLGSTVAPKSRAVIAIDPDAPALARAAKELGTRLVIATQATPAAAARSLLGRVTKPKSAAWLEAGRAALAYRPPEWATLGAATPGKLHPIEVCRALRPVLERDDEAILVCDGGEFAQWAQSLLPIKRRLINSVSGSIGASIPFAIAARTVEAKAPIVAILGDGTFGFHMAELETAARRNLPFVAIVGNDAAWNAERQIQLREYGAHRAHGCELTPARYDRVAEGLGARGWLVTSPAEMEAALGEALSCGRPAVINVIIEGHAAPIIRRGRA